jgi:hypothetical protein
MTTGSPIMCCTALQTCAMQIHRIDPEEPDASTTRQVYAVTATAIGLAWTNTCRGEDSVVRRVWAWIRRHANAADKPETIGDARQDMRNRAAQAAEARASECGSSSGNQV